MKTQDLHYVSMQKHMNERKLERLKAELPKSLANEASGDHIVSAEDADEKQAIISSLKPTDTPSEVEETETKPSRTLREYEARKQRIETLSVAERKLLTQKHIMQPGRRKVVGTDEFDQPIFKWRAERKK